MIKYEPESIAENYVSLVEEALICDHHMSLPEAKHLVQSSDLRSCICGCPYIANHYPVAKAATHLAAKSGKDLLSTGQQESAATTF